MEKNIEEIASLWLIEQKEGFSEKRQKEFERWIKDKNNKQIYEKFKNTEKSIFLMSEDLKTKLRQKVDKELNEKQNNTKYKPYLLVASILLIACVSFFTYYNPSTLIYTKVYESHYKVQKDLILPDNTKISLDAKTKLEVRFYDDKRELTFFKGSAIFDIGKDQKRAFVIYTKTNIIEDIGTSFEVSLKDDITRVSVKEGEVRVSKIYRDRYDTKPLYILKEEDSLTLNEYGKISNLTKIHKNEIAPWEDDNIVFNDTPLTKAINEFLKYTSKKVEIDKRIQYIEVTGKFKTNELKRFINSLTLVYPLKVEKKDETLYLLKKI